MSRATSDASPPPDCLAPHVGPSALPSQLLYTNTSGRGQAPNQRPISPIDPTLSARPVPHIRTNNNALHIHSIGPGSEKDTLHKIRSLAELDEEVIELELQNISEYGTSDPIRDLLAEITQWEDVRWGDDERGSITPTWGFYVFVTAYSDRAREQIPQSISTLIKLQNPALQSSSSVSPFVEEAYRRFKLDVIQDQDALDNASDDRIRAEFWALLRGLKVAEGNSIAQPQACYNTCIILDEKAINMLASLDLSGSPEKCVEVCRGRIVKVPDAWFDRSKPENGEHVGYWGVGEIGIIRLAHFYYEITSAANSGAMMDLHRLDGFF